jgi:hypothetical protein
VIERSDIETEFGGRAGWIQPIVANTPMDFECGFVLGK